MDLSYLQLIGDVCRYKYFCDEGFSVELSSGHQMSWDDAKAMEQLAERIVADTGMPWNVAIRGIFYSASTRKVLRHGCFVEMSACPSPCGS